MDVLYPLIHGKRSDKETQSPMLKIFKDMMQKDKRDPEKTNLLKEKNHDRKRKHYSGSRSKSGRQTVSSSSDHPKNEPYTTRQQEARNAQFDGCTSQHTLPFQNEKRESWWFWGDTEAKKSKAEDTCSCVSCALKKFISTDYACIACIILLLVVSVSTAIMLVYKSIPCTTSTERRLHSDKITSQKTESERLKRKIGSLGKWSFGTKKQWQNIFKKDDEPDLGSFQGNDMSSLVESENELSKILDSDKLSDIQHSDRLRDFYKKLVQTDAAIRNLRKSLNNNAYATTNNFDFSNFDINSNFDFNNNYDINSNMDINSKDNLDNSIDSDRLKRSANFHPGRFFNFKRREPGIQSKINNGKLITKSTINMTSNKKPNDKDNTSTRNKRFGNFTDEGFIIEKNKVMIQYKPSRIVPKCSHSPKDSKSHEKQLAHPFYKNTQRLDELLDQFIDKKLPDLLADRLELGVLFDKNNNNKFKLPVNEEVIVVKDDDLLKDYEQNQRPDDNQKGNDPKYYQNQRIQDNQNNNDRGTGKVLDKDEQTTAKAFFNPKEAPKIFSKDIKHSVNVFENDFFEDSVGVEKKNERTSTNGYDILLSISTLVNPAVKKPTSKPTTAFNDRPNLRKLLQANMKAEDGVVYEDLKEVLADYKEGHDDDDKENDRKKRNDYQYDTEVKEAEIKHFPLGVHNPNWKGPMPLYPDELTQMTIKSQDPENKVEIPVNNRDFAPKSDNIELLKTDVEYVEDYLDNGYERLVELAQAYSDYGVLSEKKDSTPEKKPTDKEHTLGSRKVGISMKRLKSGIKRGLKKSNLFEKLKRGRDLSEGIRIEIQPNPKDSIRPIDDVGVKLKEILNKHVKILDIVDPHAIPYAVPELTTHIHVTDLNLPITTKGKTVKGCDSNSITFKKRTLKAAELVNANNVADTIETSKFELNIDAEKERELNKHKIDTEILSDSKLTDGYANERGIDYLEVGQTKFNNNTNIEIKTSRNKSGAKHKMTQEKTANSNSKESESSLSNFFMLLSKWFGALDEIEIAAKNKSKVIPRQHKAIIKKHSNESGVSESQLAYPAYDSDMIENIGHRSRVLLSVEIANHTEKAEDNLKSEDEGNQIVTAPATTEVLIDNSTRSVHESTKSVKNGDAISNETKNRVVKRQAIDDSNLIFWNDLYDEEYGINADPIENNIRDKHSVEKNDLVKKPNTWIQDKVKKITDRFYSSNSKKAVKGKEKKDGSKQVKRNINYNPDDDENTGKLDLAALTARMKEVCKETVKAVHETKHIDVRDDNKEGQAATSLMQQLVRLMTELVDYQVQERTCRRLPPDLHSFLEWLTSSEEEDSNPETFYRDKNDVDHYGLDFSNKLDLPTEQDLQQPNERENTDSKTDCLGTLHAVQNLIREYEEMTEDDKSVMTGVKNYLENQMHFLQRQLSSIDDNKYFKRGSRFRRDVVADLGHSVAETIDDTAQHLEKQYKNFKHLYKKYKSKIGPAYKEALKTTAEINKAATEMAHKLLSYSNPKKAKCHHAKVLNRNQKVLKINDKTKEKVKHKKTQKNKKHKHRRLSNFFHKNEVTSKNKIYTNNLNYPRKIDNVYFENNAEQAYNDKDERNIKDVYFKAVEEAKKSVTKGTHKRDSDIFDKTDIFRINDYVGEKEN